MLVCEAVLSGKVLCQQTRLELGCAGLRQGILPGGGAALLHLAEFVPEFLETLTDSEERLGAEILRKSLT